MTYSLTEKEEILYERQIDELFNLTEVTPLSGDKETYTDPRTGRVQMVDPATAWRLKKADATAHYTDQYPSWDDPTAIPQQPIEPIVKKQEQEPTVSDDGPILIPPIVRTTRKVPKIIPTKPKPKPPKLIPTKPKPKPPKLIPLKHARPKIVNPLKTALPKVRLPVTTLPKAKLPIKQLPVRPTSLLPSAPEVKKLNLKPLSPRNKIAQGVAQDEINRIMAKLNNPKTSLKQGKKLLTQLNKLDNLKPLQLKIPKAQIPPRFSLPAPTDSKLTSPKLGVPDSKLTSPKLGVPKSPTVPVSKLGVPDTPKLATLGVPDPLKGTKLGPGPKLTVPKLSSTGLPMAPDVPSTEKQRLAKIASDAVKKVKTVDTKTAHLVGDDGKPIDDKTSTKTKTQVGVDPSAKSDMAKGMVQPKEGQGIKSFAKQLGYDTVDEFEKANPKGVGIDKKTGNKFVKTGVSYIDKAEVNRLNSITLGKAGKANELKIAKKKLEQAKIKGKTTLANTLEKHVASLEADIKGTKGKSPTVIGKPKVKPIGLNDLRSKWNLNRNLDMGKMYGALTKKHAGKLAAKAGGYLVPGLNVVIMTWDVLAMAERTAMAANHLGPGYKQDDIESMNAILDSEATMAEKRKAIDNFGSREGRPEYEDTWNDDVNDGADDPPLPFELKNINGRKMDINTVPIEKYEEVIGNHVTNTDNVSPFTQKDLNVLVNRIQEKKEWHLTVAKRGPSERELEVYDAKIEKLLKIRNTFPKTRKEAFKKLFSMMVDVHEQQLAKGEVLDFKHKNTEEGMTDALENAIGYANGVEEERAAKRKLAGQKRKDAGFFSVTDWGDSSLGRFTAGVGDMFSDSGPTYAYIEPGSEEDTGSATAGMGTRPSKNIDTDVVTAVGVPYGKPGAPKNFEEYETLMQGIAGEFNLPIAVVRALAMQESGMHSKGGTLSKWSYTGDPTLGKKGAFGPFHVRSDPDKGAALEHYNNEMGTSHTWKDIATDGMLAAKVGATYFKYWYDHTDGNAQKAYELYNGGPSGYMKTLSIKNAKKFQKRLDKFNESKNFANKSAILEGIAIAA